jgi:hypothetical protein
MGDAADYVPLATDQSGGIQKRRKDANFFVIGG